MGRVHCLFLEGSVILQDTYGQGIEDLFYLFLSFVHMFTTAGIEHGWVCLECEIEIP